jgi:hypothetical protein
MATKGQGDGAGAELLTAVMAKAKELKLKRKDAPSGAYFSLVKGGKGRTWNAAYVVPQRQSVRLEVHAGADELPKELVQKSGPYMGGEKWRVFTVKTEADLAPALDALEIAAGLNGKGGCD